MKRRIYTLVLVLMSFYCTSCTNCTQWEEYARYARRDPMFAIADCGEVILVGTAIMDSRGNILFKDLVSEEKLILIGDDYPMDFLHSLYESSITTKSMEQNCLAIVINGKYCSNTFLNLERGLRRFHVSLVDLIW